jgi:tRNA U34 2-thiouridine synthase MnmA/TrmU
MWRHTQLLRHTAHAIRQHTIRSAAPIALVARSTAVHPFSVCPLHSSARFQHASTAPTKSSPTLDEFDLPSYARAELEPKRIIRDPSARRSQPVTPSADLSELRSASLPHQPIVDDDAATSTAAASTVVSPPAPFHFDTVVNSLDSFASFQHAFRAHHDRFISAAAVTPSQRTVVVAISGGVDSAMTAQLLCAAGVYQRVVGVHMRNWDEIEESGHCSGERDAKDATAICAALGIPLETVDYSREYFNDVFQDLLNAYARGETPSPDVLCNRLIKFHILMQHVKQKYGEHAVLATGHYARIKQHPDDPSTTAFSSGASSPAGSFFSPQLFIGVDPRKDQSYFLSSVCASALRSCLFPLGNFEKTFLKQLAASWTNGSQIESMRATNVNAPPKSAHLPPVSSSASPFKSLSRKKESMGICFIGKRTMQSFLGEYIPLHAGEYIDVDTGAIVGRHHGWESMTLGQKAHIAGQKHKYYVCGKMTQDVDGIQLRTTNDATMSAPLPAPSHCIYVCATRNHPTLYFDELFLDELRWIDETEPIAASDATHSSSSTASSLQLRVKIRSGPSITDATLSRDAASTYRVAFSSPQFSIAAGQTCVFYDATGRRCLGEGRIGRAGPSYAQQGKPSPVRAESDAE